MLLLLIHSFGNGYSQEVSARAWTDSTSFLIGDPITVRIELKHPAGLTVQPLVGDTIGRFFVLDHIALETKDGTSNGTVVIANYDSGTAILPAIPFLCSSSGDTATRTVATNPLILHIRTVAVDTSQEIKDVKPPLTVPYTLAEIVMFLGIVSLLAGGGYYAYRRWKKGQVRKWSGEEAPPPRPAHIVAFEELGNLKEKRLWQQGLIKPYYVEISEILRRYFENRYKILALEETTDEIMKHLNDRLPDTATWQGVGAFLRRADLVKFAKAQPAIPEHEEMMNVAFDVVERTKWIQTPTTVGADLKEPVDVES